MTIDESDSFEIWRSDTVAFVDSYERVAVLDVGQEPLRSPIVLQGSACLIWRVLASRTTLSRLILELATAYDLPRDAIADDIRACVEKLIEDGLLSCASIQPSN